MEIYWIKQFLLQIPRNFSTIGSMKRFLPLVLIGISCALCGAEVPQEEFPKDYPPEELEYLNGLYEKEFDPHFSNSPEMREMLEGQQKRAGIRQDPFRLEPREPLQTTPHNDAHH